MKLDSEDCLSLMACINYQNGYANARRTNCGGVEFSHGKLTCGWSHIADVISGGAMPSGRVIVMNPQQGSQGGIDAMQACYEWLKEAGANVVKPPCFVGSHFAHEDCLRMDCKLALESVGEHVGAGRYSTRAKRAWLLLVLDRVSECASGCGQMQLLDDEQRRELDRLRTALTAEDASKTARRIQRELTKKNA